MRLGTKANIFHRLGLLNGLIKRIEEGQGAMAAAVVKNSELADYIAQFATDMAGLLVDLMVDVNELATRSGSPHIAERIDARAEIASAMLKLQNERITNGS